MTEQNKLLDTTIGNRVYNNFVKITDWLINGTNSQHKLPPAVQSFLDTYNAQTAQVQELTNLVTSLQQTVVTLREENSQLRIALQTTQNAVETVVNHIQGTQQIEQPQQVHQEPVPQPAPEPVAQPEPQPVASAELIDLDSLDATPAPQPVAQPAPQPVAQPAPQPTVTSEQVKVSAEAIGAGQLDAASFAQLDADINKLLES